MLSSFRQAFDYSSMKLAETEQKSNHSEVWVRLRPTFPKTYLAFKKKILKFQKFQNKKATRNPTDVTV